MIKVVGAGWLLFGVPVDLGGEVEETTAAGGVGGAHPGDEAVDVGAEIGVAVVVLAVGAVVNGVVQQGA